MNNWLLLLLSLTLSASIIALVLFALKPLYRERLSRTWQYYIWLVVVVRLLFPLAPETNLMARVFGGVEQGGTAVAGQMPADAPPDNVAPPARAEEDSAVEAASPAQSDSVAPAASSGFDVLPLLREHLWTVWLAVALALFVRKLTSYHSFARYIKAGRKEIRDEEALEALRLACQDTGVRRVLPLYENKLAASPMLVGILSPCIVLPDIALSPDSLRLVLRHELTHYRRADLLYKWLVQTAVCIHWFSPLVYLVSREINRNCELSCDETVLRRLPEEGRKRYGDTLLETMKTGGTYGDTVASVTLSEDGRNLKERLQAILKHHSGSRWSRIVAAGAGVVLLCGATYAGAYAGTRSANLQAGSAGMPAASDSVVTETVAAPIILRGDEYQLLAASVKGATNAVPFQVSAAHTALYIAQEGDGTFSLTVREQGTGKVVMEKSGITFADSSEPVVVFASGSGLFSLEVKTPAGGPDKVTVFGAGLEAAGQYTGIVVPSIPGVAGNIGLKIAEKIAEDVVEQLPSETIVFGMEDEKWEEYWSNQWDKNWEEGFSGNNGESWRNLNYRYRDGYLIGVGVRYGDKLENYAHTETLSLEGKSYTIAFKEADQSHAKDEGVMESIRQIMRDDILERGNKTVLNAAFYSVRSIEYNTDPQALLKSSYTERDMIKFMEMLNHCKDKPILEELLYRSGDDGESVYFMFIVEKLPGTFKPKDDKWAEELGRKAAKDDDIVMISVLDRFLPGKLHDELMHEALGMDFDFDWK